MSNALQGLVGATVSAVSITRVTDTVDPRVNDLVLQFRLPDGAARNLRVHTIDPGYDAPHGLLLYIDGEYVPDEAL